MRGRIVVGGCIAVALPAALGALAGAWPAAPGGVTVEPVEAEGPTAGSPPAARAPAALSSGSCWSPYVREKMVGDALKVAPPVLARIILRHPDALREGLARAAASEGSPEHRQDGDDAASGAAASLAAVARRAVAALDGHRPMADVVFHLGVMAHLAADLNDPFLATPAGISSAYAPDFALYAERNARRFPVVFYGYDLHAPEPGDRVAAEEQRRARGYFAHLERAYAEAEGSSASFDVRSIPFGVASICYSRAVTDIARSWLHVWRLARGDLAGTPYLPGATPAAAGALPIPSAASAPTGDPAAAAWALGSAHAGAAQPGSPGVAAADGAWDPGPGPEDEAPEAPSGAGSGAKPRAAAALGSTGVDAPGAAPDDPNAAPITKTILGKSRKRLSKGGAADPNAPVPPDPNGQEKTDASKD